jgi:flagellar hook-basal body complex protein FliE
MITEPSKINIHDVTTLLSQSEMALSMTKAITDRVINAYREITSLR